MRLKDMPEEDLKYFLYERSAQDPVPTIEFVLQAFRELRGREPLALREDFAGTFKLSCTWVADDPRRTALSLDLDPEPLSYGRRMHLSLLSSSQKRRVRVLRADVAMVTRPAADVAVVDNYSFFALKSWPQLLGYFSRCRRSLRKDGLLVLAMAGGAGFTAKLKERRTCEAGGRTKFTYIWHQRRFEPISGEGLYSIHFRLPDGRRIRDAFVYDWRVWTIPEVRLALSETGFSSSCVYWEQYDRDGESRGTWARQERADDDWSWNSYVVGSV